MPSAEVIAFPKAPRLPAPPLPPPALPRTHLLSPPHDHWTVRMAEVCKRLGIADYNDKRRNAYIRAQIEHRGMPAPLNHRIVKGVPVSGAKGVHKHSKWLRDAFEAWMDHQLPPPQLRAADDAERERLRLRLADNAAEIAA